MIKKLLIMLVIIIVLLVGIRQYIKWRPSTEEVDPITYFSEFREDQVNLVYEDMRIDLEEPILEKDDNVYISAEFAKKYIDDAIFYDENEKILTITTVNEWVRMPIDSTEISVNNETQVINNPVIEYKNKAYLPSDYIEGRYNFSIEKGADERLFTALNLEESHQLATVTKRQAVLRNYPDKKRLIIERVSKGETVIVYDIENGYARVRSENGIVGYIPESHIKLTSVREASEPIVYEPLPSSKPLDDKVKLVWDQITTKTDGSWSSSRYTSMQDVNVISPTWFSFGDEDGTLIDRASKTYVENAHARGIQVWAMMDHNFEDSSLTRAILTSTAKRQYVIDQLLEFAEVYGFDGINIDIENVQEDFAEEWVQFMRELYPQAKAKGLTVSVDVYIPSAWSYFYQRDKIAEVVDYFIVMAYDQYGSWSEEPGPVAGLPWVEEGIIANLEEVPAEKLVLGIPVYVRRWAQTEEMLETRAWRMGEVDSWIQRWGATPVYDEVSGQNYVEGEEDGKLYQVWIEDAMSIGKRVDIINRYDLAGYAMWRLGLESQDVWPELSKME